MRGLRKGGVSVQTGGQEARDDLMRGRGGEGTSDGTHQCTSKVDVLGETEVFTGVVLSLEL